MLFELSGGYFPAKRFCSAGLVLIPHLNKTVKKRAFCERTWALHKRVPVFDRRGPLQRGGHSRLQIYLGRSIYAISTIWDFKKIWLV